MSENAWQGAGRDQRSRTRSARPSYYRKARLPSVKLSGLWKDLDALSKASSRLLAHGGYNFDAAQERLERACKRQADYWETKAVLEAHVTREAARRLLARELKMQSLRLRESFPSEIVEEVEGEFAPLFARAKRELYDVSEEERKAAQGRQRLVAGLVEQRKLERD